MTLLATSGLLAAIRANDGITRHLDYMVVRDMGQTPIVVLAERYGTRDVLTFDRRHFRALRTSTGEQFRLLPDDLPR